MSKLQDFDQLSEGYDDLVESVANLLEELSDNDIWETAKVVVDKVLDKVNSHE